MDKHFIFKASDLNSKRTLIAKLVLLFVKMQRLDDAFNNYQVAILRDPIDNWLLQCVFAKYCSCTDVCGYQAPLTHNESKGVLCESHR